MENYLSEAFKSLDILDEDVFEVDKDGLTALKDFEDKDEEDDSIAVIDPDAETEEDLEDSYIGKVILDCSVCHTDIYKDKEDVVIDEESDLANIGEECPYCYSSEGFKVIGEVKPFVETTFETDDDVEVKVENESLRRKRLRESKRLDEWFESEPFAATCSVDEWEAFKNGELLFDLDSEELVTLDDAKNSGLENCLEYDRYEDYGERVKNGRVAFLMYDPGEEYHYVFDESLQEDTVKQGKYWVNKGDEGTHGKFRTKKAADEQRKAMFARGYKAESLLNEGSRLPKKSWKKIDTIEGETYYGSVYSPKAGKYGFYGNEIVFDGKRLPKNGSKVLVDIYELPEDDDYIEDPSYPYYALLNKNKAESLKESYNSTLGDLISGDSATLMSPFYLGRTGEIADVGSIVEVSNLSKKSSIPGGYHYKFYNKNGELFYEDDLWLYNYDLDKDEDDSWINPDLIKVKLIESLKESCSINQCQKWVDYDMKKYKRISDDTMEKIKSSGYSVVKDQYGDYEVIADRKDESCGKKKSRKMKEAWEEEEILDYSENDINSVVARLETVYVDPYGYVSRDAYNKVSKYLDRNYPEIKEVVIDNLIDAYGKPDDESLKESIEDITIDTGDQEISVSARDKEKKSDGEMIAPLSDEMKADIEMNSDDIDVDVNEFSEEDFDELGESYLKKVYENVKSYKTTSAKTQGNKLFIEGLIKFSSGKEKKTSFVFESRTITKSGKAKLIGENLQISRGHKSFKLTGTVNNGKFISESLNYNYRVKNGNSSQRVYGTAKKSK